MSNSGSVLFTKKNNNIDSLSVRSPFIDLEVLRDVPLKELPATAHEFLVSVIAERRNTEEARYNGALDKLRKNQSLFYDQEPLPSVQQTLKPTKEWQHIQVGDFSEVRSYVSRMRNNNKEIVLKSGCEIILWKNIIHNYDPTLSTVIGLKPDQVDSGLENLLMLLKKTKPGETISDRMGRWIYSLLSCLKQPLQSDSISILRDLAKECWTLRSRIDPDCNEAKEFAAPLSLVICIIGRYYRQLDLADSLN